MPRGIGGLGTLFKGIGASAAGRGLQLMDDFVGSGWKQLSGFATKQLAPKGMHFDPKTGVMRYTRPTDFDAGKASLRERVGDMAGTAYNKSRFMRRWAGKLDRYGRSAINSALPGYNNPGRTASKALKYTAWAGVGGGIAEMPFHFTEGGTESPLYKTIHGANVINPYYWAANSEYSPATAMFQYTTPIGLAMLGVAKGGEHVASGYANAAEQGARSAIDSTTEALANLKFSDRLGFLLSPRAAASRYRSTALDQLAQSLGHPLTSTGDPQKDAALADILRTV